MAKLLQYLEIQRKNIIGSCVFPASFDTTINLNIFHGISCGCLDIVTVAVADAAAAIGIILLYNLI